MMKNNLQKGRVTLAPRMIRLLAAIVAALMLLPCIVACDLFGKDKKEEIEVVDYVANTKLDMASESLKIEVTVKTFIDGDTTHFYLDDTTAFPEGFAKVRYLAIDTPESTGKIEEWGKSAASFTKEKLRGASAIMLYI